MPLLDHPLMSLSSFNNRYTHSFVSRNPDVLDWMFRIAMGEFGYHADLTFERYLAGLGRKKKGLTHRMAI